MSFGPAQFQRTTLLTWGLLGFLAGLGAARILPALSIWVPLVACGVAAVMWPRKRYLALVAVVGFGLLAGWWRGSVGMRALEPYAQIARKPVIVQVVAEGDAVYGDNGQLSFDGGSVELLQPFAVHMPGRIKIQGYGETAIYRGDIVRAEGRFYPTRGSRQGTLSYAALRVGERNGSVFETTRRRFVAGTQTALPEPHASFALGLLIGQRTTLPEVVQDNLSAVGLTHIIAVSGYNLTIIVRAVRRLGGERSKYQMTLLSGVLIAAFLLVTGFSASIVRAALVSLLSLLAWYYGRVFRPLLLLVLVAALTAGWNPLYIWADIGWYLSFLAFYGVLILVPLLVSRLYGPKRKPSLFRLLIYETLAAQLMTAPLIMHIFGELSLVALVSNLLVVPLVPIAMVTALAAGLTGMFVPVLSGWAALPATVLLTYILDVVGVLARVPFAWVRAGLPLPAMVVTYAVIAGVSLVLWRRSEGVETHEII